MSKDNNGALSGLDKMIAACKEKGSVTVTLKRFIGPENGKWKPGTSQKKKLEEVEKVDLGKNPTKDYPLIFHSKTDKDRVSTQVSAERVYSFTNSLINIFKLNCLKNPPKIQKKIKKPTSKNPTSKRSLKLKARVQMKKDKKIKKREKKLQKTIKMKDNKKMDLENK